MDTAANNQMESATLQRISAHPAAVQASKLVVLAALVGIPLAGGPYTSNLMAEVLIFGIMAMSLDLLIGFTGLVSFGHAAFFGVGAYAAILLGTMPGMDAWSGLLIGVALAAVAATLIGFLCTQVEGVAFLMLTLAFGQLLYSVALKWHDLTGGSDGIGGLSRPNLLSWSLNDPLLFYYTVLGFTLASYGALKRLTVSPLGQVFIGIRENEDRMRAIGYPTRRYKLLSFVIAGAFGGLSGGLYAIFNGFISPDSLYWTASGDVLIMVILGGAGTLIGPVVGAAIFLLMKYLVSAHTDHWMLIIGIVFVCCVMFFRRGVFGSLPRLLIGRRQ
jgi:branched-chain amino acid transport system permease protein